MEQGFIFSQKQQLIFSQKQIQSLKLLAMDNYELSTFLQEEYNENPLLDVKSSDSAVSRPFSKASHRMRHSSQRYALLIIITSLILS